jgi:tripartite-type tricarboxylate transporter receptor subunit TctC
MAGVNIVHVPYRGAAPILSDLLAGQVQVSFIGMFGVIDYASSGRLRALAVTTSKRFEMLPELPTVAESLPGYEISFWVGIGVAA